MRLPIALTLLLLALSFTAGAASAPGEHEFKAGVQAYRDGEYPAALDMFLMAREQGMAGGNLDFNLGLTYYRLGEYEKARELFLDLRSDLAFAPVADYHLGLIAAELGEQERAEYHLAGASALAQDTRLRQLADAAMRRSLMFEPPSVDEIGSDFDATYYLLMGTGYDTNPALVNETVQGPDETNQTPYVELAGDARQPLFPRTLGPTSLIGAVRLRNYSAHEEFDEINGELGLRRDWRGAVWRTAASLRGGVDTLGGEPFQRSAGAELEFRRTSDYATGSGVGLELRSDRLAGGEGFEYLDGWRHRAGLDGRAAFGRVRVRGSYDFTRNDRADLEDGGEFFSHSPERHSVTVAVGRWFGNALSLEARSRYRHSSYRDADRFMQNGSGVEREREEELTASGLRSRLLIAGRWSWLLDYQFSRNSSTREAFEYERHLVLLGLEWLR